MKKKLMKFAALALAAVLTLPALSTDAVRAAGIPMSASIRIGLTYGSDAVPGAAGAAGAAAVQQPCLVCGKNRHGAGQVGAAPV